MLVREITEERKKRTKPDCARAKEFVKDKKDEFKKRYGDNWKTLLYATAWKLFIHTDE